MNLRVKTLLWYGHECRHFKIKLLKRQTLQTLNRKYKISVKERNQTAAQIQRVAQGRAIWGALQHPGKKKRGWSWCRMSCRLQNTRWDPVELAWNSKVTVESSYRRTKKKDYKVTLKKLESWIPEDGVPEAGGVWCSFKSIKQAICCGKVRALGCCLCT